VSRAQLLGLLAKQPPAVVAMEACATAHDWGRAGSGLGHDVRLVPPIYVKPFVRRQKNDAGGAEAQYRPAVLRPRMDLEGPLCQVDPNDRNLLHGCLLLRGWSCNTTGVAHFDAVGRGHPPHQSPIAVTAATRIGRVLVVD
jgi:transposase